MNELQISLLCSNKELHQLHKEIMDLQNHYKQAEDQYRTKIKYRIKESINKVSYLGQSQEEPIRKQTLQDAFFKDQLMHGQIHQAFQELFFDNYLSKTLAKKVLGNYIFVRKEIQDRKIQAFPYSSLKAKKDEEKEKQQLAQVEREIQILSKQTLDNSINATKHELEKQKHANYTLSKDISLLQNELESLDSYCQSFESKAKKTQEKSQKIHEEISESPCKSEQQEFIPDQELSSQVQCLERLIKSKNQLVSDLSNANHLLRLKTSELKSKQVYLNKKRLILESNALPKLQHELSQLLEVIRINVSSNSGSQTPDQTIEKPEEESKELKNKLFETAQELSDIKQLIDSTLSKQIMKEKKNHLQNHLL